ncbi:MAG TPA: cytochrome c oxidase subunit II [Chloroflexota bacterium]|jgi:cytochrome c oxidase subunit 2|nr:cytochrome c oxidase subunit II [Chloroflexota bacterium]
MTQRSSGVLSRVRRCALLLAALGVLLLGAACGAPTPQQAFNAHSEYAAEGDNLFFLIIVMGVVIGAIVEAVLIWAAIRYRRRPGDRLPPQIHGNTIVEILWTTGPVIVVGYILFVTLPVIFRTQAPAPSGSMDVRVVGHQFWWEFQYPDANVVTANELHLPTGRAANLILLSDDVIHSFWIPALGGKRDAFPGHTNYIWMTPDSTGEFPGQCYQLCGYSHGNMRERAIIQSPSDFQTWLTAQQQPALTPPATDANATEGAQLFQNRGCAGCHTISGTAAAGKVGPNLTHFGSRHTVAGSIFDNTPQNLRTWLKDPPGVKPGSIMPNLGLNDHELDVLVAYLQSLK